MFIISEEPSPLSTASDKQFCDMLTRFLFLGGHIALRQLVHLDVSVFSELRRRHTIQEAKKESAQNESIAPSAVKKGKKTVCDVPSCTSIPYMSQYTRTARVRTFGCASI